MAGKSNYLEGKFLDHVFRATALAQPANVYIALFTAAPSDAGGGTEVSGNGYARVAVPRADGSWSAPSGTPRAIANAATLYFSPNPTATWGQVTHFGVFDALTGGNLLYWAGLGTAKTVNAGDTVSFPASSITISED